MTSFESWFSLPFFASEKTEWRLKKINGITSKIYFFSFGSILRLIQGVYIVEEFYNWNGRNENQNDAKEKKRSFNSR